MQSRTYAKVIYNCRLNIDRTFVIKENNISCECFPYYSIVKGEIENGLSITVFEILENDFKEKIWDKLTEKMDIKCAFIDSPSYRGCSSNWPDVFAISNCP